MTKHQKQIQEFMQMVQQETPSKPTPPSRLVAMMRVRIIAEELIELARALGVKIEIDAMDEYADVSEGTGIVDMVLVADALADLEYVNTGTAIAVGIDMELIFAEVHRSNMSKLPGGHKREDGKWIKRPDYSPANIAPIVEAQNVP
jgi:predicted HAD superfamily Cof-like phosphohydrolase